MNYVNKQKIRSWLTVALALPLLYSTIVSYGQSKAGGAKASNGLSAIKESDIKRDLFALAGDHFRGREGGSLDELKASVWIADQLRAMGLQPAGDDGTFFQFFHIQRTRITETSRLNMGSHQLTHGQDAFILAPAIASVDAPLVFVGKGTPEDLAKVDIKGKAVALEFSGTGPAEISYRRFLFGTMNRRAAELVKAGALAVIWVSDTRLSFISTDGQRDSNAVGMICRVARIPRFFAGTNYLASRHGIRVGQTTQSAVYQCCERRELQLPIRQYRRESTRYRS